MWEMDPGLKLLLGQTNKEWKYSGETSVKGIKWTKLRVTLRAESFDLHAFLVSHNLSSYSLI